VLLNQLRKKSIERERYGKNEKLTKLECATRALASAGRFWQPPINLREHFAQRGRYLLRLQQGVRRSAAAATAPANDANDRAAYDTLSEKQSAAKFLVQAVTLTVIVVATLTVHFWWPRGRFGYKKQQQLGKQRIQVTLPCARTVRSRSHIIASIV
jgi:hypothetical protein